MARPRPLTAAATTVKVAGRDGPIKPAGDLECWLRAAFPPGPRGGLDLERIAVTLGRRPSTVRRWIANDTPIDPAPLKRRAILRGRGNILWPAPDPVTIWRDNQAAAGAAEAARRARCGEEVRNRSGHGAWDKPHRLHLLWWPDAHVFVPHVNGPGGNHKWIPRLDADSPERIQILTDLAIRQGASRTEAIRWAVQTARALVDEQDVGEIKGVYERHALLIDVRSYRNKYEAAVALYKLLGANGHRRCVVPAELVTQGRTHALRGPLNQPPSLCPGRRRRASSTAGAS